MEVIKLNKKGFTLVELLAVVGILLAISVIAIASISATIERSQQKHNDVTEMLIINYAKLYVSEFKNTLIDCVDVATLKEHYNLEDDTIKDSKGKLFDGSVIRDVTDNSYSYSVNKCIYG